MNKFLESKGSEDNFLRSDSSKSLIGTINTGFDNSYQENTFTEDPTLKIQPSIREDSVMDSMNTGFGEYDKINIERPKPEINLNNNVIKICNKDCSKEDEIIINENIIPTVVIKNECVKRKDSIMTDLNTGFSSDQTIVVECKKPVFKTHLCKELYLGEFNSETEKKLARNNLNVYSKQETHIIVQEQISNFVTKNEVEEIIKDLDYTSSEFRSYVNYEIPDNLFK